MPATAASAQDAQDEILDRRTGDFDELHAAVSQVFKPHDCQPASRCGRIAGSIRMRRLGDLATVELSYGAEVRIIPGTLEPYTIVQMPLSGSSPLSCGRQSMVSTPAAASVVTSHLPTRLSYSADCAQHIVRFETDRLHRHCAQMLGRELKRPIEFDIAMPLDSGAGPEWLRLAAFVRAEAQQPNSLLRAPLAAASLEQLLMTTLLTTQSHTYSDALAQPQPAAAPYYVKRAEAIMEERTDEPLSVAAIAEEIGVSERSLFQGFQQFRGVTPMGRLKAMRLERVHADLMSAQPGKASVTDIAMKWGFSHLGHFAKSYKDRFGHSPNETLRNTMN